MSVTVSPEQELENRRQEYAATNESYMHYDGFRWSAGSFLIAGVFIFWGLLSQGASVPNSFIIPASVLVALLMSIWLLFAYHYRQIYRYKLHRLAELEQILGARQHTRFQGKKPIYDTGWLKGHILDLATYVVTSLGAIVLGIARNGWDPWYLLTIGLVAIVLVWVVVGELCFKVPATGLQEVAPTRAAD